MFYQIFLSPQVKRCTIITYKHGIDVLPHELPNDLRLITHEIRIHQESAQTPQNDSAVPNPPRKNKNFVDTRKNP